MMKSRCGSDETPSNDEETKKRQKEFLKELMDAFDKRNPDIHGKKRDMVRTRYWYCIVFGGDKPEIPSDSVVLNSIETSMKSYDFKYLESNQDESFNVHWKTTKESFENINLISYKNWDTFKSKCIRGKIYNENNLRNKFEKIKREQEDINHIVDKIRTKIDSEKKSSDDEYEDLIIPKRKKKTK